MQNKHKQMQKSEQIQWVFTSSKATMEAMKHASADANYTILTKLVKLNMKRNLYRIY